jgi:hypothetical protein
MSGIENRFPAHIQKLLKAKGYFDISNEERIQKHKETLEKLKQIPHFNYAAGREALKELRGE